MKATTYNEYEFYDKALKKYEVWVDRSTLNTIRNVKEEFYLALFEYYNFEVPEELLKSRKLDVIHRNKRYQTYYAYVEFCESIIYYYKKYKNIDARILLMLGGFMERVEEFFKDYNLGEPFYIFIPHKGGYEDEDK